MPIPFLVINNKYGKAPTLTANGSWEHNNHVCIPLNTTQDGKAQCLRSSYFKDGIRNMVGNNVDKRTCVAIPNALSGEVVIDKQTIYEVKNGFIGIKGKSYSIKLPDGFYIIRKLTISECRRLQTIPDWYIMPCSATQSYKQLGNGWTVEVVKHYLSYIPDILSADIDVISLYDGMSCGRIALTELGANIRSYKAYEIDKFAIQTTQANFPDTVQLGDAFAVRAANWKINT